MTDGQAIEAVESKRQLSINALEANASVYENAGLTKIYENNIRLLGKCLTALRERVKQNKGCKYCNGKSALYQSTSHTKIYINTIGKARTIETECSACPPYASCCMRGVAARSAFTINFCPNCGKRLKDDE